MRLKIMCLLVTFLLPQYGRAQQPKTAEELAAIASDISAEATLLYKLQKASLEGTDVFILHYKGDDNRIDGYFSYPDLNGFTCVFYSGQKTPLAIGTIHFGAEPEAATAKIDLEERPFIDEEMIYFTMRRKAMALVSRKDSIEVHKGTSFNIIPLIHKGQRKTYVLTATAKEGIMILGNDYLLSFDEELNVSGTQRLHKALLEFRHGAEHKVASLHSHAEEGSPFMTVTDLCTLMLYKKATGIKSHKVIAGQYLSSWDGGNAITIEYFNGEPTLPAAGTTKD